VPPDNKECDVNILPKKFYFRKRPTDGFVQKIRTSGGKHSKQTFLFKRQELPWTGIAQSVQRFARGWTVKNRIPVKASSSACIRTGAEDHPATHTIVTGSFSGSKLLGSGVEPPPTSKAEDKERVMYLHSPLCVFKSGSRANILPFLCS